MTITDAMDGAGMLNNDYWTPIASVEIPSSAERVIGHAAGKPSFRDNRIIGGIRILYQGIVKSTGTGNSDPCSVPAYAHINEDANGGGTLTVEMYSSLPPYCMCGSWRFWHTKSLTITDAMYGTGNLFNDYWTPIASVEIPPTVERVIGHAVAKPSFRDNRIIAGIRILYQGIVKSTGTGNSDPCSVPAYAHINEDANGGGTLTVEMYSSFPPYCANGSWRFWDVMPTPETKSNFVGTISTPSSLSPQAAGATPMILNSLTIQNTGDKSGSCNINVYEATSAGVDIKILNDTVVTLNQDGIYDWINEAAINGLSKAYAAGDTLYLCFKTWGIDESEPSCGGSVVSIPVQSETETKEYFLIQ